MLKFKILENLDKAPQIQYLNWTYIRRSEDVQDVFWTSYVRSIYVLCLWEAKQPFSVNHKMAHSK